MTADDQLEFFPPAWIPFTEALARMTAILGSRRQAELELYGLLCDGKKLRAAERRIRRYDGGEFFTLVPPSFWKELLKKAVPSWSEGLAPLGRPHQISYGTMVMFAVRQAERPIVLDFECWFFLDRDQFDALYPAGAVAADTADADSTDRVPENSRRRRRSKKEWRKYIAREIHRALKEGNPVPSVEDLAQHCEDTIKYQPDTGDIYKLINQLLARLIT